jgi:hypothetical protein
MKSFVPKEGSSEPPKDGGRNAERDFHGEKRTNETHASTTDPDARLIRKGIKGNASPRSTIGADKNYYYADFVAGLRKQGCVPHVAQNNTRRRSAIDARTTRHPGYKISQIKGKRIEEPFGWMKTVGVRRKTRHCERELAEWSFVLTAAAYNLIRIPNILAAAGRVRPDTNNAPQNHSNLLASPRNSRLQDSLSAKSTFSAACWISVGHRQARSH